jgi:hypothetical protein
MATETGKMAAALCNWRDTLFFCLGSAKAAMVATATMSATTTMTTMARTMATMANYGSKPFSLPCLCAVKFLENAVKLFGRTLFTHNFGGTFQHMRNRTCLFLLHFWTDLIGLRKNVTCPFLNGPKLTELKIMKVLLASGKKMLAKMRKAVTELVSWQN